MAFREKIAWLTLTTLLVAYGAYFLIAGPAVEFGKNNLVDIIWSFGPVAALHAIAVIIGSIVLAMASPREANQGADERDRAITRRSCAIGYTVLLIGIGFVGLIMPFSEPPYKMINVTLAFIVLAEGLRYAVVVSSYRLGWHG